MSKSIRNIGKYVFCTIFFYPHVCFETYFCEAQRELESLKVFLEDVCRLTDHIYHMNGKTVNYEESV